MPSNMRMSQIIIAVLACCLLLQAESKTGSKTESKVESKAESTPAESPHPPHPLQTPQSRSASKPPHAATSPMHFDASRVFVGIGALLALQQDLYPSTKTTRLAPSVSMRGGYQYRFFAPLIVRIYLDYTMSVRPTGLESIFTSHFLINSDVVSYFFTLGAVDFGVFGGFGLGLGSYGREVREDPNALDSVLAKGFSAVVNSGISVLFSKMHRVELGAKCPLSSLTLPSPLSREYQEVQVLLMYDYVF